MPTAIAEVDNLSDKEALEILAKAEARVTLRYEEDAFYHYEPSDGIVPEENLWLLKKHLKPEDIPLRFDSQVDFHLSPCCIKAIFGGNQAGKSAALAVHCYIVGTGEIPRSLKGKFPEDEIIRKNNVRGRIVGIDNKQLSNTVIPAFQKWVPKSYLKKGLWSESFSVEKKLLMLYVPGGSVVKLTIEFMTNEQDVESFQGPPLDFIGYDEEPKKKIREENLLRFVTADKLREYYAFTPTHGISWATELFLDTKDDEGNVLAKFELCTVTNKKANLEVVDKILAQITDYKTKKMRLLGEVISLSGLVYGKLFDTNIHVIPWFALDKQKYIVYRGLDPHTVKPTVAVEIAVDRMKFKYVCGVYKNDVDTEIIKAELAQRAKERHYRLGWSRCDVSANSTIKALGDRNIFLELGQGKNAVPALCTAQKYAGSRHAGVDVIKQSLKVNEQTGKPNLLIMDTEENQLLIKSLKTLERDIHANEDKRGPKDEIAEGMHDSHAALRYAFQAQMNWIPPVLDVPVYQEERYI